MRSHRISRRRRTTLQVGATIITALLPISVANQSGATSASAYVHDPNLQIPGTYDDGLPNCGVAQLSALSGYIGPDRQEPAGTMDVRFEQPPATHWCTTNVGYSSETYGSGGAEFTVPATANGLFPYNNAEILPRPVTEPGMTQTYKVRGSDVATLNGTAGWGLSNRTVDPLHLEMAWFAWWGDTGTTKTALEPVANLMIEPATGQPNPRGFAIMVKRAGESRLRVKYLDPSLLSRTHDYAVALTPTDVSFFIDGRAVGSFVDPPTGTAHDFSGRRLSLMGQFWIDTAAWVPWPLPDFNAVPHSIRLARYVQGWTGSTPLTLD